MHWLFIAGWSQKEAFENCNSCSLLLSLPPVLVGEYGKASSRTHAMSPLHPRVSKQTWTCSSKRKHDGSWVSPDTQFVFRFFRLSQKYL